MLWEIFIRELLVYPVVKDANDNKPDLAGHFAACTLAVSRVRLNIDIPSEHVFHYGY